MTNKKTKDNVGIVYLFTNDCYEKENLYKFGVTINPNQRKSIQENSTPPKYQFIYKIVLFSADYKKIEKWLKEQFNNKNMIAKGKGSGKEWVEALFDDIFSIFKEALKVFPNPNTKMCSEGKCYHCVNGKIEMMKNLPKCQLDLLGITNGEKIKCIKNNKYYVVQDNKILVDGCTEPVPLSTFISQNFARNTGTNEHSGYQFFTYKNVKVFDLWQRLVNIKNGD